MAGKAQPENRIGAGKAATQFKPGVSGNPGGRPKSIAEVQELARQHTPAAINELARIASAGTSEAARVAACNTLLDRAWGKAPQSIDHTSADGSMAIPQLLVTLFSGKASDDVGTTTH